METTLSLISQFPTDKKGRELFIRQTKELILSGTRNVLEFAVILAAMEKIIAELKTLTTAHPQAAEIQTFLFSKKFPTDVRHNSKIIREKLTKLATDY
jgi:hypothetical protein